MLKELIINISHSKKNVKPILNKYNPNKKKEKENKKKKKEIT